MEIYGLILKGKLSFPPSFPKHARDMVSPRSNPHPHPHPHPNPNPNPHPHPHPHPHPEQVTRLLYEKPPQRLGCQKRGGRDVREHAFFQKVDFQKLEDKVRVRVRARARA